MTQDYDKMYEHYKESVGFSSNPHDRHVLSVEPAEEWPGMGNFQIGDNFTREEFEEKMKTDEDFRQRWDPTLIRAASKGYYGGRIMELILLEALVENHTYEEMKDYIKKRLKETREEEARNKN